MPPEYVFTARSAASLSRKAASSSRARLLAAARGVLPGQPGELPDLMSLAHHILPADGCVPAVGPYERGEYSYRRRLPRAVRPQQPEH
jgi:hypothetical protein